MNRAELFSLASVLPVGGSAVVSPKQGFIPSGVLLPLEGVAFPFRVFKGVRKETMNICRFLEGFLQHIAAMPSKQI